jgi:Predicted periplasmic or secreted lipoprotein
MKTRFAMSLVLASALLAPVVSHADGDTDRTHPVSFVKDSIVTAKIKAKLAAEHMGSLAQIKVDTDAHGAVELSGYARTEAQAEKAVQIAKATEGVTSVHSSVTIKKDD